MGNVSVGRVHERCRIEMPVVVLDKSCDRSVTHVSLHGTVQGGAVASFSDNLPFVTGGVLQVTDPVTIPVPTTHRSTCLPVPPKELLRHRVSSGRASLLTRRRCSPLFGSWRK